jgi:hypothetical protein
VPRKELTAFRIDPAVMEGLRHVKERDGVPLSVQVDRALRAWLKLRRVGQATGRRSGGQGKPRVTRRKDLP